MKIRTGFVSNSSSSSFVVAFPKKPSSREELQRLLFRDSKSYGAYGNNYSTEQVVTTVWDDLSGQTPMTPALVCEAFQGGTLQAPGGPEYPQWGADRAQYDKAHDEYRRKFDEWAQNAATEFLKDNEGAEVFSFHYSDNDGSYHAALEHGDLFASLPHMRVSHH